MENLPENITLTSGFPKSQERNFTFHWQPTGETTPTIETNELIGTLYENQLQMKVYIYERYGKLLPASSGRTAGWDGTYNEKKCPPTIIGIALYWKTDEA